MGLGGILAICRVSKLSEWESLLMVFVVGQLSFSELNSIKSTKITKIGNLQNL